MSKNNSQPLVEIRMGHEKLKRFRQNTAQLCKNFRTPAHWRRETIRADLGIVPSKAYHPLFVATLEEYGQNIYSYYYDLSF